MLTTRVRRVRAIVAAARERYSPMGRLLAALSLVGVLSAVPVAAQCPAEQLCICTGDCDRDDQVGIVELQACVNGFLGEEVCAICDSDLDQEVSIIELQGAVNGFLDAEICIPTALARIDVGSAAAARGTEVTLPIELRSHLEDVVTVAPLRLKFNSNALAFVGCATAVGDKTAIAASPDAETASVVLYSDPFADPAQALDPIPDGQIVNCTFGVHQAAPVGPSTVSFDSAGLSDSSFNDVMAIGSDGVVTIQ